MKKVFLSIIALAMIMTTDGLFAQTSSDDDSHQLTIKIPEVALIGIVPESNSITLEATAPTVPGDPIELDDDNEDLWLNYSSIVPGNAGNRRTITAELDAAVPGIDIKVNAQGFSATTSNDNRGITGGSAGEITLGTTGLDVVNGIGSSFTSKGVNNGHQLKYSFSLKDGDYGAIFAEDHEIIVTYTITETN